MQSSTQEIIPILGTAMGGGFYAGRILIEGNPFALIVSPKAAGEHKPSIWIPKYKEIPAARSYNDGLANTRTMAKAGSKLAGKILDMRINDFGDWYLPSQDELEVIYRNLKPTTNQNSCWARSGINLSTIEPTRPYTPDFPLQTLAECFQQGGAEAFEEEAYWTSTQHASDSGFAWYQHFDYGYQYRCYAHDKLRARAVRRLSI